EAGIAADRAGRCLRDDPAGTRRAGHRAHPAPRLAPPARRSYRLRRGEIARRAARDPAQRHARRGDEAAELIRRAYGIRCHVAAKSRSWLRSTSDTAQYAMPSCTQWTTL